MGKLKFESIGTKFENTLCLHIINMKMNIFIHSRKCFVENATFYARRRTREILKLLK